MAEQFDRLALSERDDAVTAFAVQIDGGVLAIDVGHGALGELDEFLGPDAVEVVVADGTSSVIGLAHAAADVNGEVLIGALAKVTATLGVARSDVGSDVKIANVATLDGAIDDVFQVRGAFYVTATDGNLGVVRVDVTASVFIALDHDVSS